MNAAGLRAALRIARRDALRAKGRSALVVAMIGLPMLGLSFADVAARTAQLPPEVRAERELGAADLVAVLAMSGPLVQQTFWDVTPVDKTSAAWMPPETDPDVASALPPGSRVTTRKTFYGVRVLAGDRAVPVDVLQADLADPMAKGLTRLRAGAYPKSAGEAALSPETADVLDAGIGDTVTVDGAGTFRVTGIVVHPSALRADAVYVSTAAAVPGELGTAPGSGRHWAVTLPSGARDLDSKPALNAMGFRVLPRTWYFDPPPEPHAGNDLDAEGVGVAVVVVGLATLEIVLLAGTAFAVGARRRQRELALVAAHGGDRSDVRRIVLAGAVVLGAFAGVAGVAAGIAGVVAARPWLGYLVGSELGPLDVRPLELGLIVLVGAGTALLAALLPARTAARQHVVAALTGRRLDARARGRVPYVAFAAIAVGAGVAFWAAGDGAVPAAQTSDGGPPVAISGRPANFPLLLAGAVVAELGFVACAPALVAVVGRLARRLPLALRLAARDAARHRTRSGPAVAAVVAAVAGSVALSVYVSSDTERQRQEYRQQHPMGYVSIGRSDPASPASDADIAATVAKLPVAQRVDTFQVAESCQPGDDEGCGYWQLDLPHRHRCREDVVDAECYRRAPNFNHVVAADDPFVEWVTGRDEPRARAALRAGRAVVFDERWIDDGAITLVWSEFSMDGTPGRTRRVRVPAVAVAPGYGHTTAVLTPAAARAAGLPLLPSETVLRTSRVPTEAEEAQARAVLTRAAVYASLYVERGFRPNDSVVLLAMVLASSVVTVGATAVATGLAAADSRPDLATLAAVGAPPRVRRRLAMAQAATVAALGSVLGILAGLVPALAVVAARAEVPLALPWRALLTTAVGVPLLAALVIGGVTRSRLPLARRMA